VIRAKKEREKNRMEKTKDLFKKFKKIISEKFRTSPNYRTVKMKILGFSPLDHDSLSDIYLCPTTLFQDTFTRHCFSLFQSIL